MSDRISKKHSAGFTLAELLIVVAILLVLIAIAVPLFTGALGKAEDATCASNRRSVQSMFYAAYALGDDKDSDSIFNQCIDEMETENNNTTCPTGGTYVRKDDDGQGHIVVQCSRHGMDADLSMWYWVQETFNGAWHQFTDKDGHRLTGDPDIRKQYAEQHGLTEWGSVKGLGKNGEDATLYIEFKSYGNSASSTFLYAGANKDPGATDWVAYYICDNTGLLGGDSKGQWYRVTSNPHGENIAKNSAEEMRAILEKNKDNKVSLVGGEFVEK